ncbi:MAG: hypothetical protein DMG13_08990 [Acidobacteria bacterium]|nr:MAG: hypothetical protein DMG13_08990 [Acidobacteriota bacterium]
MRHAIPHNQCWYSLITKKTVRENPGQFQAADVGRFLFRECVDLFDERQVVTLGDIKRQLEVFRTGRLSSATCLA